MKIKKEKKENKKITPIRTLYLSSEAYDLLYQCFGYVSVMKGNKFLVESMAQIEKEVDNQLELII